MKKFTINCDFGGQMAPFTIFIGDPEAGHHPLHFQADWLTKERNGTIPSQVMDAISKLKDLADRNNVSLEELCVYALGSVGQNNEEQPGDGANPQEGSADSQNSIEAPIENTAQSNDNNLLAPDGDTIQSIEGVQLTDQEEQANNNQTLSSEQESKIENDNKQVDNIVQEYKSIETSNETNNEQINNNPLVEQNQQIPVTSAVEVAQATTIDSAIENSSINSVTEINQTQELTPNQVSLNNISTESIESQNNEAPELTNDANQSDAIQVMNKEEQAELSNKEPSQAINIEEGIKAVSRDMQNSQSIEDIKSAEVQQTTAEDPNNTKYDKNETSLSDVK